MKRTQKAIWFAAIGLLTFAGAIQAQFTTTYPPGDLIIGFTTTAGNDVMYDLGKATALTNGKTWNLASQLTAYGNYSGVYWGVIGNSTNTGTARYAYSTTLPGVVPNSVNASTFTALNNAAKTMYQNFTNAGAGQSCTVGASIDWSWNQATINGANSSYYVNAYENPNVQGVTSTDFSKMLNDGSAPVLLGQFTLAANGVVTFITNSSVVAAPVAGFAGTPTAGFAPLKIAFTDTSTGSITNWLWNFGDGHKLTNSTSVSVTNIYALSGTYAVTLTVTGAGGASTNVQSNYITVSTTPQIGKTTFGNGKFVLTGTNCPIGVQYRILMSTNLGTTNWIPVQTNTFAANSTFAYTNSSVTNGRAFFRLVSP
jgi:PKD repeat protein